VLLLLRDLIALAGYTFSSVMGLFGIGNLLLKFKRKKLPRPENKRNSSGYSGYILVIVAFVGNVQLNVDSFYTFIKYLIPSLLFVGIMLGRSFDPVMIDALEYFTNQCVKW
jgi:peptidoglycan/LPS O-acetylase OafA/YrhL